MKKKTLKEVVKEQLYWSDTENSPFHWDQGTGNPYDLINNFNDFAPDLHFGGDHFSPYLKVQMRMNYLCVYFIKALLEVVDLQARYKTFNCIKIYAME